MKIIFTLGKVHTSICSRSERLCGDRKTTNRQWSYCRSYVQCKYNNKYCNAWVMTHVWFAWIWWLLLHYYYDVNHNYCIIITIQLSILHQTTCISIIWRDLYYCYSWDNIVGARLLSVWSYFGSLLYFRFCYISQSLNSVTLQYTIWFYNLIVWWNLMYLILYRVMHFNSIWHMCVSKSVV